MNFVERLSLIPGLQVDVAPDHKGRDSIFILVRENFAPLEDLQASLIPVGAGNTNISVMWLPKDPYMAVTVCISLSAPLVTFIRVMDALISLEKDLLDEDGDIILDFGSRINAL